MLPANEKVDEYGIYLNKSTKRPVRLVGPLGIEVVKLGIGFVNAYRLAGKEEAYRRTLLALPTE